MMLPKMLTVLCVVAVAGLAVPTLAGDCPACKSIAEKGEGFCGSCGTGLAYGVKIASKPLYDALQGVNLNLDKVKCAGCKDAAKKNGRCNRCNIGLANGKAFESPVAHMLATGSLVTKAQAAHCDTCRTAFKANGFCTACNTGYVATRMFRDLDTHNNALAAHKILVKAAKTAQKCERCALAMVTDGTCKRCRVSFKGGQAIKLEE